MIKVLHIFNEYLPKTEIWAFDLMNATNKVQHEILAKYYSHLDIFGQDHKLHFTEENIIQKEYDRTSKKEIIRKIKLWNRAKNNMPFQDQIKNVVERTKLDILHFHFGTTAADCLQTIISTTCKTVVSFYGWDYIKAPKIESKYSALYQSVFEHADAVLVEGPAGGNSLTELGCDARKIYHQPLGIHKSIQSLSSKVRQVNKLRLVQIASFAEKKGQLYTVKALKQCIDQGLQISLELVGNIRDEKYFNEVRDYISTHNLDSNISIKSWIDFDQIESFLSNFDAFIHPSCHASDGDCEGGSPVIILQAQACGLPIIATDHCDIPNQVIDGKTGYLTEEKNLLALAKSIQRMATLSDEEYSYMSSCAIKNMKENFTYDILAKNLFSIYSNLLS